MYDSGFRKLKVSQVFSGAMFTIVALVFTVEGSTQQFMIRDVAGGNNEAISKQFTEQLASQNNEAATRLASRIADITRACDLSEIQVKKLEVAAKGAVKATMKEVKANLVRQAKSMGFEFDPDAADEESDEDDDEADGDDEGAGQAGMANVIRRVVINGGVGNRSASVENQKIWKSSVKKVLSDEQWNQWEEWQADRIAYQTKMAVGNFVAKVDRRLLLSGTQREKLATHLGEKHGELLRKREGNENGQFGVRRVFLVNGVNNGAGNDENSKEVDTIVAEILTAPQLALWSKEFAPKLLGNAGRIGVGAFNLNVNGAALNVVERLEVLEEDVEDADEEDKEDNDD